MLDDFIGLAKKPFEFINWVQIGKCAWDFDPCFVYCWWILILVFVISFKVWTRWSSNPGWIWNTLFIGDLNVRWLISIFVWVWGYHYFYLLCLATYFISCILLPLSSGYESNSFVGFMISSSFATSHVMNKTKIHQFERMAKIYVLF